MLQAGIGTADLTPVSPTPFVSGSDICAQRGAIEGKGAALRVSQRVCEMAIASTRCLTPPLFVRVRREPLMDGAK